MTLRTGPLRIDPVAVAFDGLRIIALQEPVNHREVLQPVIALAPPGVAEDHDGGRALPLEIAGELGAESLDARVAFVVEEVEVVEKARGLPNMEAPWGTRPARSRASAETRASFSAIQRASAASTPLTPRRPTATTSMARASARERASAGLARHDVFTCAASGADASAQRKTASG